MKTSKMKYLFSAISIYYFATLSLHAQANSASYVKSLMDAMEERFGATEDVYAASFDLMNNYFNTAMASEDVVIYSDRYNGYELSPPQVGFRYSFLKKFHPPYFRADFTREDAPYTQPPENYYYAISSDPEQTEANRQEAVIERQRDIDRATEGLANVNSEEYVPSTNLPYDTEDLTPHTTLDIISYRKAIAEGWVNARKSWHETGDDSWSIGESGSIVDHTYTPGVHPDFETVNQEYLDYDLKIWTMSHESKVKRFTSYLNSLTSGNVIGYLDQDQLNSFRAADALAYSTWEDNVDAWWEAEMFKAAQNYMEAVEEYKEKLEIESNSEETRNAWYKYHYLRSLFSDLEVIYDEENDWTASYLLTSQQNGKPCGATFVKKTIQWTHENPSGLVQELVALNEISKYLDYIAPFYINHLQNENISSPTDIRTIKSKGSDLVPIGIVNRDNYIAKVQAIAQRLKNYDTLIWPMMSRKYIAPMSLPVGEIQTGNVVRNIGESGPHAYVGGKSFYSPAYSPLFTVHSGVDDLLRFSDALPEVNPTISGYVDWYKGINGLVRHSQGESQLSSFYYIYSRYGHGNLNDISVSKAGREGNLYLANAIENPSLHSLTSSSIPVDNQVRLYDFNQMPLKLSGSLVNFQYSVDDSDDYTPSTATKYDDLIDDANLRLRNLSYKIQRNYPSGAAAYGYPEMLEVSTSVAQGTSTTPSYFYKVSVTDDVKPGLPQDQLNQDNIKYFQPTEIHGVMQMLFKPEFEHTPDQPDYKNVSNASFRIGPSLDGEAISLFFSIPFDGNMPVDSPEIELKLAKIDYSGKVLYGTDYVAYYPSEDIKHGFWGKMEIVGSSSGLSIETVTPPDILTYLSEAANSSDYEAPNLSAFLCSILSGDRRAITKITGEHGRLEIEWLDHYDFILKYFYGGSTTPQVTYSVKVGGVSANTLIGTSTGVAQYPEGFESISIEKNDELVALATIVADDGTTATTQTENEFFKVEYYKSSNDVEYTSYYSYDFDPLNQKFALYVDNVHSGGSTVSSALYIDDFGDEDSSFKLFMPYQKEDWVTDGEDFSAEPMTKLSPYDTLGWNDSSVFGFYFREVFSPKPKRYTDSFVSDSGGSDWTHLPFLRGSKSITYVGDDWTRNGESYEYDHSGNLQEYHYKINTLDASRVVTQAGNTVTDKTKVSGNTMRSDTIDYPDGLKTIKSTKDGVYAETKLYLPGESDGLPWAIKSKKDPLGEITYTYAIQTDGGLKTERTFDPAGSGPDQVLITTVSKNGSVLSQISKVGSNEVEKMIASGHDTNPLFLPSHVEVTSYGITNSMDFTYYPDGSVKKTTSSDGVTDDYVWDVLGRLKSGSKFDGISVTPQYNGFQNSLTAGEVGVSSEVDAYGRVATQEANVATSQSKTSRDANGAYLAEHPDENRSALTDLTPDGLPQKVSAGFGQSGASLTYEISPINGVNCLKVTSYVLDDDGSPTDSFISVYYDGYGRTVLVESPHPQIANTKISTSYSYNTSLRRITITPPAPQAQAVIQYSEDWSTKTVTQGTLTAEMSAILDQNKLTRTYKFNDREIAKDVAGLTDGKTVTTTGNGRDPITMQKTPDGNQTEISSRSGSIKREYDKDGLKKISGNVSGKSLSFEPQRNNEGRATSYLVKPPGASNAYNITTNDDGLATSLTGPDVNFSITPTYPDGGTAQEITNNNQASTSNFEIDKSGVTRLTETNSSEPLKIEGNPHDGLLRISDPADPTRGVDVEYGPTLEPLKMTRADGSGTLFNLAADSSIDSYKLFAGATYQDSDHEFQLHRDTHGSHTGGFSGDHTNLTVIRGTDLLPNSILPSKYIFSVNDGLGFEGTHIEEILGYHDDQPSHVRYSSILDGFEVKRLFNQDSSEPYRVEIWKGNDLVHHVNYDGLTEAPSKIRSSGFELNYKYDEETGQWQGWQAGQLNATREVDTIDRLSSIRFNVGADVYRYETTQYDGSRRKVINSTIPGMPNETWTHTYGLNQLQSSESSTGKNYEYNHDGRGNREGTGADQLNRYALFQSAGAREYTVAGRVNPGVTVTITRNEGANPITEQVNVASSGHFSKTYPVPEDQEGAASIPIEVKGILPGAGANGTNAIAIENRLARVSPEEWPISYGAHGRVAADWRWKYLWSDTGALIGIDTQAAAVDTAGYPDIRMRFFYDQDGRRIRKTSEYRIGGDVTRTVTTRFVYDGWDLMAEEITDTAVAGGQPKMKYYIWGLDLTESRNATGGVGALMAIKDEDKIYLPTYDLNGNIIAIVDYATGAQIATWQRGPFGELISKTGNSDICPFGFATHYTDSESGLVYFGKRYYSPETGRWISLDPQGELESFNLYAYCHNDPINKVDVLGLAEAEVRAHIAQAKAKLKEINEALAELNELDGNDLLERVEEIEKMYEDYLIALKSGNQELTKFMKEGWFMSFRGADDQLVADLAEYPTLVHGMRMDTSMANSFKQLYKEHSVEISSQISTLEITHTTLKYTEGTCNVVLVATGVGGLAVNGGRILATEGVKALAKFAVKQAAIQVGTYAGAYAIQESLEFAGVPPEKAGLIMKGAELFSAVRGLRMAKMLPKRLPASPDVNVQPKVEVAVTPKARLAGEVGYTGNTNFGKYLRSYAGAAPQGMIRPHAHHIVVKGEMSGRSNMTQLYARASRKILRNHEIDPFHGSENLMWAPNAGHSNRYIKEVYRRLWRADRDGADINDELQSIGDDVLLGIFPN